MEPLLSIDTLLVAGWWRRLQLALPVGSSSFRHACGKYRIEKRKREESNTRKKKRRWADYCL
jgi:hypothetical protein